VLRALNRFFSQIYSSLFEKPFLRQTERFYVSESHAKKAELEVHEYLLHVERRIAEEKNLCITCMDTSTL